MGEFIKKYAEVFGEGFPSYQIARGRTEEEVIAIIKNCIDSGKDAYEMGYVTDELDTLY